MGIREWLAQWRGDYPLGAMADEVATRTFDDAWQLVQQRIGSLQGRELVGYVRARTRSVVMNEAARAIAGAGGLRSDLQGQLIDMAHVSLLRLVEARHRTQSAAAHAKRRAA